MPAIGFQMRLPRDRIAGTKFTANWFDQRAVIRDMDRKTHSALSRFGYFVMRDARQSLKVRKKSSQPGQPPSLWSGGIGGPGYLLRHIYFHYDRARKGVIIGPAKLAGVSAGEQSVPQLLEEGGLSRGRRQRRPFRIAPRPYMQPAFDRQIQKQAHRLREAGIEIRGLA